jgi:hypothetical protein
MDQSPDLRAQHLLGEAFGLQEAVQRVFHTPEQASFIALPLVLAP